MHNIQSIFQALIPQEGSKQSGQSSAVVTERVITSNQPSPKYVLGSQQPSFAANVSDSNFVGSPRNLRVGGQAISSETQSRANESKSGITTTYYNSSSVSPVPARTFQFSSSAYQSPEQNITAFNAGGYNSSEGNRINTKTVTYANKIAQNEAEKEVDSTSRVQQQLYKTSPLVQNITSGETYEYKRIINGGSNTLKNDGSVSPVNNLLDGDGNGGERRFFSTYAGGNQYTVKEGGQSVGNSNSFGQGNQRAQSATESIYEYHPIKTTTVIANTKQVSPVVNFANGSNGVKQSYESHSYTGYKPSQVSKVTFGQGNVAFNGASKQYQGEYNKGLTPGNAYGTSYHYVSSRPQEINLYNNNAQSYNMTKNTTQTIQSPQIIQTYQSHSIQPQSTYQQSTRQQQTRIQNKNQTQLYQVVDQIERPKYQKLYGLEDTYGRRMVVEQDPPTKKGCCGPLCWLPLLLIGGVLALFGMLCGLGVICPGGGGLKTVQAAQDVFVEPSIVVNTTEPSKVVPIIRPTIVPPQTVTPSVIEPSQQPAFNAGTPGYQPVTPSYIPPISVAPSANPSSPIIPNITTVIPVVNGSVLPQFNASLPAISQPVIEFAPEVIRYDKNVDEYAIDATPHIVGVVTNVNSEVVNVTNGGSQGVSSLIDYTANMSGTVSSGNLSNVVNPIIAVSNISANAGSSAVTVANATVDDSNSIQIAPIEISPQVVVSPSIATISETTISSINPSTVNNTQAIQSQVDDGAIDAVVFVVPANITTSAVITSQVSSQPISVASNATSVAVSSQPIATVSNATTMAVNNQANAQGNVTGNGYVTIVEQVVVTPGAKPVNGSIDGSGAINTIDATIPVLASVITTKPSSIVSTKPLPMTNPTILPTPSAAIASEYIQLEPEISASTVSITPTSATSKTTETTIAPTTAPSIDIEPTFNPIQTTTNFTQVNTVNTTTSATNKSLLVLPITRVEATIAPSASSSVNASSADILAPLLISASPSVVNASNTTAFSPSIAPLEPAISASPVPLTLAIQPPIDIEPIMPDIMPDIQPSSA